MKTEFLTKEQIEGIHKIDKWLKDSQKNDLVGVIRIAREALDKILEKGYYTELERDLLNELRRQYLEDNRKELLL